MFTLLRQCWSFINEPSTPSQTLAPSDLPSDTDPKVVRKLRDLRALPVLEALVPWVLAVGVLIAVALVWEDVLRGWRAYLCSAVAVVVMLSVGGMLNRRGTRRIHRFLREHSICPWCGYDCTGLSTRVCPECGAASADDATGDN